MMTESVRCCQELPDFPAAKSPFSKLVILGYYDGATSGVLQCEMCQTAYRFEMLDWDEKQKVRIYSLAPLPQNSFNDLVEVLKQCGKQPYWPNWVLIWDFASEEVESIADRKVWQILDGANFVEFIVASECLHEKILVTKRVIMEELKHFLGGPPEKELELIPDWFAWDDVYSIPDWFAFLRV